MRTSEVSRAAGTTAAASSWLLRRMVPAGRQWRGQLWRSRASRRAAAMASPPITIQGPPTIIGSIH
jgi:hypothetical protein